MKRRAFLQNMTSLVVVPSLLNSLSIKGINTMPMLAAIANADTSDRVLVLVQLKGGNDGLNTVIPLNQYAAYSNARSNIAIKQSDVLALNGTTNTGLHPAMTSIQKLFNDGKVKIIQSVGYPSPNFSHFRATDILLSASDSSQVINTGWMGRYLDTQYPNFPDGYPNTTMADPLAIEVGSILSLGFQGPQVNMSISVSDPTNFYNMINGIQDEVPNTPAGKELAYIRATTTQTNQYGSRIKDAANNIVEQSPAYPVYKSNSLADQLKIVARLIAGGLKTKVYMVSLGGFDTHNSQVDATNTSIGNHANLLGKLSVAINAFMEDLTFLNISNRVVGMTYSEFGRRIKSNLSVGTDHGAAAPMFLFGNNVISGILGTNPTIPAVATVSDNIPMQYDFRSVYASVLEQWFGLNKTVLDTVMLKNFQSLALINANGADVKIVPETTKTLISNYPNPFLNTTTITFVTKGEHTSVEIIDTSGKRLIMLTDKNYEAGSYSLIFDGTTLAPGVYYARLQNEHIQQVRAMLKN
jgi:uncharacterized protein (DUF1501 family)